MINKKTQPVLTFETFDLHNDPNIPKMGQTYIIDGEGYEVLSVIQEPKENDDDTIPYRVFVSLR